MLTDTQIQYVRGNDGINGVPLVWVIDGECLYDIPTWEVYKEMFKHMQSRLQESGYIDIEHMMFHHLRSDLVETISKIGIQGNIAPNGVGIKE